MDTFCLNIFNDFDDRKLWCDGVGISETEWLISQSLFRSGSYDINETIKTGKVFFILFEILENCVFAI